ncbi:protein fatty acid export 3, chloroplastic isoform X1 [Tanacetum coccineum]
MASRIGELRISSRVENSQVKASLRISSRVKASLRLPSRVKASLKYRVESRTLKILSKLLRSSSFVIGVVLELETVRSELNRVETDPPDIEIKGEVTRLEDGDSVSFEERTMKFSKSGEDFEVCFNKKSRVITKQTSKKLKIQDDIDVIIVEPVKDMFDASASTTDDTKDVWKTQDFHLGIPYCGMLSLGGVFSFMITGSICATKLNIILGGTFLALSIIGLRSLKEGNSSAIAVTGQAG